jgi:branched-chain amino acid transport system permease protein
VSAEDDGRARDWIATFMNWDVLGQQLWNGILNGSVYVLFASGLTLVFGVMRVINMAHGELMMIGGMVFYSLAALAGLPLLAAVLGAILAAGLVGAVMNRLAVRPFLPGSERTVILSSLGMSLVLLHGSVAIWGTVPLSVEVSFDRFIELGGILLTVRQLLVVVTALVAMVGLELTLRRTIVGKIWRATAENPLGAQLVGISVRRVYLETILLASGMAGLAGVLLTLLSSAFPDMGQQFLITGFAIVIIAGVGSVRGVVIVGFAIGILEAMFAQFVSSDLRQAFVYALMIVVLLVRPEGVFGRQ